MKKSLSLILAIVMVAALMISVMPFASFAEEAETKNICRVGSMEFEALDLAFMIIGLSTEDVTLTLLDDVTVTGQTRLLSPKDPTTGKPYKLTIDGNGHTLYANSANVFPVGQGGTEDIVIKDLDIEFSGITGAIFHFYAGGNIHFEDMVITATTPVQWTLFNANFQNDENNPLNVTFENVDMFQPAYGTRLSNGGEGNFLRAGNGTVGTNAPYSNYYFNNCNMIAIDCEWTAEAGGATKGIYVTHENCYWELTNCYIKSKNSPIYITSGIKDTQKTLVKLVNTKLEMIDPIDPETGKATFKNGAEGKDDSRPIIYTPAPVVIEGEYVAPVGEAQFIAEGEAAVDCSTLAEALTKAAASTKNCTVKLNKDITTDAVIQLSTANKDVVLTFDGNDKTLNLTAGNAIKVAADGVEAKINITDLDINYSTGAGSIIQVYANGEVNITDVKINNTAKLNWCAVNALNKAGTTLTMTIDDCVFVSEAEGNNADVGVIRTGNGGNTVALTITNTDVVVVGNGGEKPATALNVTSELATVVVDDCSFTATANNAIRVSKDITTKVAVTNSVLKVNEGVEITNKADLVDLAVGCVVVVGGVASDVTEPVETTEPVVETTEPTVETTAPTVETTPAPVVTTPAATDAPTTTTGGGCGGIAVAAQLVALICAAAAVVIIKKK